MEASWCLLIKQQHGLLNRIYLIPVVAALLFLSVPLIGCGQPPIEEISQHPEVKETFPTFPEVVRIDWLEHKQCSGSLIAPTLVLTAAHCLWDKSIQHQPNALPDELTIRNNSYFQSFADESDASKPLPLFIVQSIHLHPSYRPSPCDPPVSPAEIAACRSLPQECLPTPTTHESWLQCYEDLRKKAPAAYQVLHQALVHQVYDAAILQLAQPVDLPTAQLPSPEQNPPLLPGEQVLLSGYGDQPDGKNGLQHVVKSSIAQVYTTEFIAGMGANERQACAGDSGGPAYIARSESNGHVQWLQSGIHYAVFGANCSGGSIHINTTSLLPWINQFQHRAALAPTAALTPAPQASPILQPIPVGVSAASEAELPTKPMIEGAHPLGWLLVAFLLWRYFQRHPVPFQP